MERLFAAACERGPQERAAFLARACTTDPALRRDVESLLAAHERAGDFLVSLDEERVAELIRAALLSEESRTNPTSAARPLHELKVALADRYNVQSEIGHGGMATVYLATDMKHGRQVAIKVLRPELAAALGTERFLREIRLAAGLDHPHIVPVHDSGEAGGFLYYVMPYVEGESLRELLSRQNELPLEDALRIALEVADALDYAHSHGVIHRDIKPENILLAGGHARVADFGIARAVTAAGGEKLTETGIAVGTPAYMSPEQGLGSRELDSRSDVYSLGCVVYEMLSGALPFSGPTPQSILRRKTVEPAPSFRQGRGSVPQTIEHVVMNALAPAPEDRYTTAVELAHALKRAYSQVASPVAVPVSGWRFLFRSRAGLVMAVLVLGLLSATAWLLVRSARTRWALETALPEIQRLIDQRELVASYRLARRAEPYLAGNPEFQRLWKRTSFQVLIRTTPPGADVYVNAYGAGDADRILVGVSPVETSIPGGYLRFSVERRGFQTLEAASVGYQSPFDFILEPIDRRPEMIRVPAGGPMQVPPAPPPQELGPYWLDRNEVTNRQFKQFVEGGGYREHAFWIQPIVLEGRVVPWEQGMAGLVDRTGRPGPSTWQLGTFREGEDDFPVSGVSWYEASAYCQFMGKQLPTFHHWYKAAGMVNFSSILTVSNFDGQRSARVGTYRGIGPFGHYDMAGNVREWVSNAVRDRRYVLGGAWSDPSYMFYLPYASSPWDRSPQNGFRCASYPTESAEILGAELDVWGRQHKPRPVDEAEFRLYRSLYSYSPGALNPKVESVDEETGPWRQETVSFDAPYGDTRILAHLFLPRSGKPPYQAVVFYPGVQAWALEWSSDMEIRWFDFIVRTGRALLFPVYEGTFERRSASFLLRERVIHWTLDIRRSIDYLETRGDIDVGKLAYYGFSTGAWRGPIFTALEPRFKASVLLSGGLWNPTTFPVPAAEVNPTNFAPRATVPVLMVNGQDDFFFPLESSQRPLFQLLGAPGPHKRHAVVEGGHIPSDWQNVVKEVLDWLDRYLGPVEASTSF